MRLCFGPLLNNLEGMGATHFLPSLGRLLNRPPSHRGSKVGDQNSAYLMLTGWFLSLCRVPTESGDLIDGEEARQLGIVLKAVDEHETFSAAVGLAKKIASQSPIAISTCLRTLRNRQDKDLETSLWNEAHSQAICYADPDIREGRSRLSIVLELISLVQGIASIKEKRKPKF